jgi:hypothetical protein
VSVGAIPEVHWEDAAATDDNESEEEAEEKAEWAAAAAAAAAELADEAKWEDAAAAESEDDAAAAESEGDVPAADSEDDADTGEPDTPPRGWPSNSARRDPRKAELFRRLDAACEARRIQEARLLQRKRPPPPPGAGDPDEPIWPPKSPHWRRFRYTYSPSTPALLTNV